MKTVPTDNLTTKTSSTNVEKKSGFHCPFLAWLFAFYVWVIALPMLLSDMIDWKNYGSEIIPPIQKLLAWFGSYIFANPESIPLVIMIPGSLLFAISQSLKR